MGRKSLGKGLDAMLPKNNSADESDDSVLEEASKDKTELESVTETDSPVAWDSVEETQRLEVYEKALNRAWVDGAISPDEKGIIDDMRDYLKITESEHREIESRIIAQQEIVKSVELTESETVEDVTPDVEHINCPKCTSDIAIEYSEDEKIRLKCPECGAKGRIPNPYLAKKIIEEERERVREEETQKEMKGKKGKKDKKGKKEKKLEAEGETEIEAEAEAETDVAVEEVVLVEAEDFTEVTVEEVSVEEIEVDSPPPDEKVDEVEVKEDMTAEEPVKDEEVEIWDKADIEEKLKNVKIKLEGHLNGSPGGPEPGPVEGPVAPEPTLPFGIRLSDDTPEIMTFICPHCTSPFNTPTSEDPQKIPCPTCTKNVTIIKPITFKCPECTNTFPSVIQGDSKRMPCPYCAVEIELRK